MPETLGKHGSDLEPYKAKFNDAMYIWVRALERNHRLSNSGGWKMDHGYLEDK